MLLLDTQVLLWLVDDSRRLGPRARASIESARFVHVSAATVWELTIKSMLGKLHVPADLNELLREQGLTTLPVTAEHAAGIRNFPQIARHDPFDRLLVSQAALDELTLLTADRVLLDLDLPFLTDATR